MGGSSKQPNKTTTIQDIPPEFKPAFTSLFNSAFGAARAAAGQGGFGSTSSPTPALPGVFGQTPTQAFNAQQAPGLGSFQNALNAGLFGGGGFQGGSTPIGAQDPYWRQSKESRAVRDFNNPGGFSSPIQGGGVGGSKQIPLAGGPPIIGEAFGGQFLAPTNPLEQESLAMREQIGRNLAGAGNNLMDLGQFTAAGGFLDPSTNPFLLDTINFAMTPAIQNFTGSVLPGFESQALQSGAFKGSSARDFGIASLGGQFGRDILGTANTIAFQNLANERQLQQNAGNLIDQAARLNQLSPEILQQAGIGQRDIFQRQLDEQLLRFQEQQGAPFRPLEMLAGIVQGGGIGNTLTNFGPTPSAGSLGIQGALGGAGLGAGAGNLLFGNTAGTLGGGALGGLLGGIGGALA
jgi:hypothetical protein